MKTRVIPGPRTSNTDGSDKPGRSRGTTHRTRHADEQATSHASAAALDSRDLLLAVLVLSCAYVASSPGGADVS